MPCGHAAVQFREATGGANQAVVFAFMRCNHGGRCPCHCVMVDGYAMGRLLGTALRRCGACRDRNKSA